MTLAAAPPRTLRKRERTRGELVAAAERLVADRGMDALSIDDITEEADVAKGTFYTHFAGKHDLGAAIARHIRLEREDKITSLNHGIADAAVRMSNGLSTMLAFAITHPIRARALLRLAPGIVDPETPMNTGIRGDVVLGLKTKRFTVTALNAAVVVTMGAAMAAIMRLTDTNHRLAEPYAFAADIVATALVALGLKQPEAARLAAAAMTARKKEALT